MIHVDISNHYYSVITADYASVNSLPVELIVYRYEWLGHGRETRLAQWVIHDHNTFQVSTPIVLQQSNCNANNCYRITIETNGRVAEELIINGTSTLWRDKHVSNIVSNVINTSTNPLTPDECYAPKPTIHKDTIKRMILEGMHYRDNPDNHELTVDEIAERIFQRHTYYKKVLNEI